MPTLTNVTKNPRVLHDKRGRTVSLAPGASASVELTEADERRYGRPGSAFQLGGALPQAGQANGTHGRRKAPERMFVTEQANRQAKPASPAARLLADEQAGEFQNFFLFQKEARRILGKDTPKNRTDILDALRQMASAG